MASDAFPWMYTKRTIKQMWRCQPQIPNQQGLSERFLGDQAPLVPEKTKFGLYKIPCGIEVEVEGITREWPGRFTLWSVTNDGSLRNNGVELISVPILGRNIDYALAELKWALDSQPEKSFSHRCSTHVHINVADLDYTQIIYLTALYGCFEKLFFYLVNEEREHNPYCYPITTLDISREQFANFVVPESKYCAFNPLHFRDYGSLEFRHMQGAEDLEVLERWIQVIQKLVSYIKDANLEELHHRILALNTNSAYGALLSDVFDPIHRMLWGELDLQEYMEDGVTWSKMFLTA